MKITINLIPFSTVQGIEIFSRNIISDILKLKKDEEFFILCTEDMPELLNFSQDKVIKMKGLKKKYRKKKTKTFLMKKCISLIRLIEGILFYGFYIGSNTGVRLTKFFIKNLKKRTNIF